MRQSSLKYAIITRFSGLIITLITGAISFAILCTVFALLAICLMLAGNSCNPTPALHSKPVTLHFTAKNQNTVLPLAANFSNSITDMSATTPSRIILYAADIRMLTGCSKRTSQRQIAALKKELNLLPHQFIAIEDYCKCKGLNYQKTLQQLKLI